MCTLGLIGNPSLNHRYRKGFYSLFKTLQQNLLENFATEPRCPITKVQPSPRHLTKSIENLSVIIISNGLLFP